MLYSVSAIMAGSLIRINNYWCFIMDPAGQQGAFWIAVSGHGLTLETVPFLTPTSKQADIMAV